MGRFYNTAESEFVRDNVYTPPWEVLSSALLKKDNDVQQTANDLELLRSLNIDKLDIDNANAEKIKADVNSQVDELTANIQKNLLDPSNRAALNNLTRDVNTRYNSGDIYKIQQSAKNYREFEKKLEEDKTLSSPQKEMHKQAYWNEFVKNNPEGSVNNFYTPGPVVGDMNYLDEYTTQFNKLKPDEKKNIVEKLGGRWNSMTETQRDKMVWDNGLQEFVEARPDVKESLIQQGKSPVYADRGIKFNPDGSLNYKEGYLKNLTEAAKELDYTKKVDSKTYKVNDWQMFDETNAIAKAKEKQAREDYLATTNKDTSPSFAVSNNMRARNKAELDKIKQGLIIGPNKNGIPASQYKPKDLDQIDEIKLVELLTKSLQKDPNNKVLKQKLHDTQKLISTTQSYMKGTYNPLVTQFGVTPEKTQKLITEHDKQIASKFNSLKLVFPDMEAVDSEDVVNKTNMKNYQNVSPGAFVNQTVTTPYNEKVKVKRVSYVPGSNTVNIDPRTRGLGDINHNDAHVMVRFYYDAPEGKGKEEYFEKEAFYDMSTGVGLDIK